MEKENLVLEAKLRAVLSSLRLPRILQDGYMERTTTGRFQFIYNGYKVGHVDIAVGDDFPLGSVFRAEFQFYEITPEEFHENSELRERPETDRVKPV